MLKKTRNWIKDPGHPEFPHGTLSGYKKGCRCYECKRARADYDLKRKGVAVPQFRKFLGMPLDHPDYPHGTVIGYRYCKCERCRAANAEYKAPANERMRQSPEFKARQRELNVAYKETDAGRAKRKAAHALRKAQMRGADCSDEDRKLLELIYGSCPYGYQVDHIHPLSKGGKHHPDNLQYLPAAINNRKRSRTDFDSSAHAIRWQDTLREPSTTIP